MSSSTKKRPPAVRLSSRSTPSTAGSASTSFIMARSVSRSMARSMRSRKARQSNWPPDQSTKPLTAAAAQRSRSSPNHDPSRPTTTTAVTKPSAR
jgi:hypothetical protein